MSAIPDSVGRHGWRAWHCFAHWRPEHVDAFLTTTLAPLLDGLRGDGKLADWFFIRYWEGGPHLRIRVRGADQATADHLTAELAGALAAAPYPALPLDMSRYHEEIGATGALAAAAEQHGTVVPMPYQPETARYGGPAAMPVAEEVFCRSSAIAVRVVEATGGKGRRLAAAADFAIATGLALGLDQLAAARWLRQLAGSWRWRAETAMLPPAALHTQVARTLDEKAPALARRWDRLAALIAAGTTEFPAGQWAAVIADARRRLEPADPRQAVTGRWWGVWSSQLHMLYNRIGVGPDEERSVCWLVANACLAPAGPAPFFVDGATAADRRYHEASKFLVGREPDQLPREVDQPAPVGPRPPARPAATLPEPRPVTTTLGQALRDRMSGRGRLTGPIDGTDLSSLLWHAYGITHTRELRLPDGSHHRYEHRAYPSAGGSYLIGVRLIVRDVAGVDPGTYDADAAGRTLRWVGPAASLPDLEATSMWFGPQTLSRGGIDLTAVPVVLGVTADLGRLRARYGLRALRFAALEAGHLAQTLALVGAATGLAVGMIGGFYDDLAHEVFGLDGVDGVLFYQLPVGRRDPRPSGKAGGQAPV